MRHIGSIADMLSHKVDQPASPNKPRPSQREKTQPIFGMIGLGLALMGVVLCLSVPWIHTSVINQTTANDLPARQLQTEGPEQERPDESKSDETKGRWVSQITQKISSEIKRKVVEKIQGDEPTERTRKETSRAAKETPGNKWLVFSTFSLGVSAFLLGVVGTCRREDLGVCGCAMILGIGSIVLYYLLSILVGIAALLLLIMFFASLDISV